MLCALGSLGLGQLANVANLHIIRALCQLIPAGIVALHFDCRLPTAASPPSPNRETHSSPSRELIHICMRSHHMPVLTSSPAESAIAKLLLLNSGGATHSIRRRIIPGTQAHGRCRYELRGGQCCCSHHPGSPASTLHTNLANSVDRSA